jgi:hypothetical protein
VWIRSFTHLSLSIVSPLGSVVISGNETQFFNSGDDVTLNCTAQGGPNNLFRWQKAGVDLEEENLPTLTISNITVFQAGIYTCTVNNTAGSDSASVTVNIRPQFTSVFEDFLQDNGDSVTLTCEAESFPDPMYTWRRVDGDGGILSNFSNLSFDAVAFEDGGDYFCTVTSAGIEIQSESVTLTSELCLEGSCNYYYPHCFNGCDSDMDTIWPNQDPVYLP